MEPTKPKDPQRVEQLETELRKLLVLAPTEDGLVIAFRYQAHAWSRPELYPAIADALKRNQ